MLPLPVSATPHDPISLDAKSPGRRPIEDCNEQTSRCLGPRSAHAGPL